jgi:hypothetical protein
VTLFQHDGVLKGTEEIKVPERSIQNIPLSLSSLVGLGMDFAESFVSRERPLFQLTD